MSMQVAAATGDQVLQAYFDGLLVADVPVDQAAADSAERAITAPAAPLSCYACVLTGVRLLIPEQAIRNIDTKPLALRNDNDGNHWLAGFCTVDTEQLAVVDALPLLGLPGSAIANRRPDVLVRLIGYDYAIAVPVEGTSLTIDPDSVTWRGRQGTRPWLAGTIYSSRDVLLDLDGLTRMLASPVKRAEP